MKHTTVFEDPFSQEIWEQTYKDHKDETVNDTIRRIATAIASVEDTEEKRVEWAEKFYEMMSGFKVVPAGRILSNAGTEWAGTTLMNCFVGPRVKHDTDSLEGIYAHLLSQSQTLKSEGGWGENFSYIRPRGAFIDGIGVETPGAVKYMELFDKASEIITAGSGRKSANKKAKGKIRKGAMMGVLDCISGDTLIDTIDGKIKVKDLVGLNPYVYCTDTKGNIFVRQAAKVWSKGIKNTVKIKFDTGDYLECTPDHEILLSTGEYKKAKDLRFGESVSALTVVLNKNYLACAVTGSRKPMHVHNAIFEMKYGYYPTILGAKKRDKELTLAHHLDHNSLNNHPDNIVEMTLSEYSKQYDDNFKLGRSKRKGKTWEELYGKEKADSIKEKYKSKRKGQLAWNKGLTGKEYSAHYSNGFSNHKVLSVECSIEQEVFDISVPEFHNFSANGVFVHNCWHPDIIEFVTAKQQPGRLTKFNISVNVTDDFMDRVVKINELEAQGGQEEAIAALDKWDLIFPDTKHPAHKKEWAGDIKLWKAKGYPVNVYQTVSVKWLWDLIMQSTYNRAEPGILFLDRANDLNELNYKETIYATNPCLTGDTLVYVADGRENVSIKALADNGKDVPVFCLDNTGKIVVRIMRNPRLTGKNQKVFKVNFDDGTTIKVTENHKFRLLDGKYVEVKDMTSGMSVTALTKYETSLKKMLNADDKSGQDYWWLTTGKGDTVAEHRLIAAHHNNIDTIGSGLVVHHKDFNTKNNDPNNLVIMTKEDHDQLHGENMRGDNNPMRRAQTEWSDEKWERYRKNVSVATAGLKNGNSNPITNEELKNHMLALTKELGHHVSNSDWQKYAKAKNLPAYWSKWREDHLGSVRGLAKWASLELGFEGAELDPRILRRIKSESEQGYDVVVLNDQVLYNKKCEICGTNFVTDRKEHGICSASCKTKMLSRVQSDPFTRDKIAESFNKTVDARKNKLKESQARMFNDLKFELSRIPLKKEWVEKCSMANISAEISRASSPFRSFSDLKDFASIQNHRIVSIEFAGYEDVYNGTVDEFHNFFVGGKESLTKDGKRKISYVNNLQCGEQTLAPGGVCNLITQNLTQFVNKDFTDLDYRKVDKYARLMVRFADNVNSYSTAPLKEYVDSMRDKRRIGCGVMGWGSALLMMKVPFGSERAIQIREKLMKTFSHAVVEASVELAEEKGAFKHCIPEKHADAKFFQQIGIKQEIIERIRKTGIRNSSLISCQPNGSSSIYANVVSGGIEPIFMHEYVRTVIVPTMPDEIAAECPRWFEGEWRETELFKFTKEGDEEILKGVFNGTTYKIDKNRGLTKEVLCEDYGVRSLKARGEWNVNDPHVVGALQLTTAQHVNDLEGFAKYVDSAISKTINLPNEYPFDDFKTLYVHGYKTGYIKGLTTYRSGTMTTVLAEKETATNGRTEEIILDEVSIPNSAPATMKVLKAEGRKWYLTVVWNETHNRPFAFFVHTNSYEKGVIAADAVERLLELAIRKGIKQDHIDQIMDKIKGDDNVSKVARMISLNLRHGVLIKNIVATLDKVDAPLGSFVFHIKKYLAGFIQDGEKVEGSVCQNCGSDQVVFQEGCQKCLSCGSSKCG